MKKFISNKADISKINAVFAMILVMVGIAYYYLINLTTDLVWVVMCGFLFVAIPALFTLLHGAFAKRGDIVLMSIGFFMLGVLGFVAKLLHGIGQLTWYSYLYAATYALSGVFVYSMIDKVAFNKRMLSKWWFAILMIVVSVVPTVLIYVLPENLINVMLIVRNVVNILMFVVALALGVYCIIKNKGKAFSYAYSIYSGLIAVAYIFQMIGTTSIRWYNLFLMLGMIVIPYVLLYAVQCKE